MGTLAPAGRLMPAQRVERLSGIRHLIIVAGPSGAGKSTFVKQLLTGQLPADLTRRLPPGAARWPELRTSALDRWLPAILETADRSEIPGLILDYDLTGRGVLAGSGYEGDPIWALPRLATKTTIISLLPDADLLVSQSRRREQTRRTFHGARNSRGNPVARVVTRLISAVEGLASPGSIVRFQIVAARIFPPRLLLGYRNLMKHLKVLARAPDIEKQHFRVERKLEHYKRKGWLDEIYSRWRLHVAALSGSGAAIEQIFVEPGRVESAGTCSWRVVEQQAAD